MALRALPLIVALPLAALLVGCGDGPGDVVDSRVASSSSPTLETPTPTPGPSTDAGPVCGDACVGFKAALVPLSECYEDGATLCAAELTVVYLAAGDVVDALAGSDAVSAESLVDAVEAAEAKADEYTAAECYDAAPGDAECQLLLGNAVVGYSSAGMLAGTVQ